MSEVVVTGVEAGYGGGPVLRGVDLTIAEGTVGAVLGPSGSGKSTLLRIVAGLHRPTAGVVRIGDLVVDDGRTTVPPERRGIGLVPQSGALFPHLNVAANIGFGLREGARDSRGRRVGELVELTGLLGLERRMPHQLSGGQRQRVALARALAPDPQVVLLDEPFAALDASLRVSLRAEVLRILRSAGATAMLVTHDQSEAMSLADSIVVLRDGVVEQAGTPAEVYGAPRTPWVGSFVGDATLLAGVSDGRAVHTVLGRLEHPAGDAGAVQALVRPEQVALGGDGVPAVVEAIDFQGHDALVTLRVGDTDVRSRVTASELPTVGATVMAEVRGVVPVYPDDGRSHPRR